MPPAPQARGTWKETREGAGAQGAEDKPNHPGSPSQGLREWLMVRDSGDQSTEEKGKQWRALGTEPKAGLAPQLCPATEQAQQENTLPPPQCTANHISRPWGPGREGRLGVGYD